MSDRDEAGISAQEEGTRQYVDSGVGIPDRLERLWAPYRMSYIKKDSAHPQESEASSTDSRPHDPFMELPQLADEDSLIVARGNSVYCVLNLYPYNSGHMMIVTYRQVANLEDLTAEESQEMMAFAQSAVKVLKAVSHPDAVNVGLNLGKASGGSIGQHIHMHVVPRWSGDSNFMTVIDGTKVLPQLLRDTRSLLAGEWASRSDTPGEAHA